MGKSYCVSPQGSWKIFARVDIVLAIVTTTVIIGLFIVRLINGCQNKNVPASKDELNLNMGSSMEDYFFLIYAIVSLFLEFYLFTLIRMAAEDEGDYVRCKRWFILRLILLSSCGFIIMYGVFSGNWRASGVYCFHAVTFIYRIGELIVADSLLDEIKILMLASSVECRP